MKNIKIIKNGFGKKAFAFIDIKGAYVFNIFGLAVLVYK